MSKIKHLLNMAQLEMSTDSEVLDVQKENEVIGYLYDLFEN